MKASRSLLIVICVACLLLGACQGVWVSYDTEYHDSQSADKPQAQPQAQPQDQTQPTDWIGLEPSQSKDVTLEVVNMDDDIWLIYDPTLWEIDDSRGYNFLSAKDFSGCNIMLNFGHGMDWTVYDTESEQQTIGNTILSVSRWFTISDGETVLVGFYFDDFYLSVEGPNAETLPDECINLVYDVIINSEAKGFRP